MEGKEHKLTPEQIRGVNTLMWVIGVIIAAVIVGMLGCPAVKLYKASIDRSIAVKKSEADYDITLNAAIAKRDAAPILAQADSIRRVREMEVDSIRKHREMNWYRLSTIFIEK